MCFDDKATDMVDIMDCGEDLVGVKDKYEGKADRRMIPVPLIVARRCIL